MSLNLVNFNTNTKFGMLNNQKVIYLSFCFSCKSKNRGFATKATPNNALLKDNQQIVVDNNKAKLNTNKRKAKLVATTNKQELSSSKSEKLGNIKAKLSSSKSEKKNNLKAKASSNSDLKTSNLRNGKNKNRLKKADPIENQSLRPAERIKPKLRPAKRIENKLRPAERIKPKLRPAERILGWVPPKLESVFNNKIKALIQQIDRLISRNTQLEQKYVKLEEQYVQLEEHNNSIDKTLDEAHSLALQHLSYKQTMTNLVDNQKAVIKQAANKQSDLFEQLIVANNQLEKANKKIQDLEEAAVKANKKIKDLNVEVDQWSYYILNEYDKNDYKKPAKVINPPKKIWAKPLPERTPAVWGLVRVNTRKNQINPQSAKPESAKPQPAKKPEININNTENINNSENINNTENINNSENINNTENINNSEKKVYLGRKPRYDNSARFDQFNRLKKPVARNNFDNNRNKENLESNNFATEQSETEFEEYVYDVNRNYRENFVNKSVYEGHYTGPKRTYENNPNKQVGRGHYTGLFTELAPEDIKELLSNCPKKDDSK